MIHQKHSLYLSIVDSYVRGMTTYLLAAIAGLLTGAGLIVAVGPQNIFVLQQGVRRAHVNPVIAVCALSDVVLIVVEWRVSARWCRRIPRWSRSRRSQVGHTW